MHTYTPRSVAVILTEGFHLTAACWGMLGGRNKDLDKLGASPAPCSMYESVWMWEPQPFRLHAVLLCLFYFVSSINDEAPGGWEREKGTQPSPGGKRARRWALSPSASPTSPPNRSAPWWINKDSLRTCVAKINDTCDGVLLQRLRCCLCFWCSFFFFYSEYRAWLPLKGNILVITQCTSILNLVTLLITSWKQSFVRALPLN